MKLKTEFSTTLKFIWKNYNSIIISEFSNIKSIAKRLRKGETVLYPTDTIWGIGGDSTNAEVIQKIYQIKDRPDSKSLVCLVKDMEMLQNITEVSEHVVDILENSTKPTTVIYSDVKQIHPSAKASDGSCAIRIVNDDYCKELINELGVPLLSTSANISGSPSPLQFSDISQHIIDSVDTIINYRKNEKMDVASKIIKVNGREIIVIRE